MLSGIISFSYNRLLKDYRDAVDHTFEVISTIDNALLRLQDAETGQRGFIITGDESYLAPFGPVGRSSPEFYQICTRLFLTMPISKAGSQACGSLPKAN